MKGALTNYPPSGIGNGEHYLYAQVANISVVRDIPASKFDKLWNLCALPEDMIFVYDNVLQKYSALEHIFEIRDFAIDEQTSLLVWYQMLSESQRGAADLQLLGLGASRGKGASGKRKSSENGRSSSKQPSAAKKTKTRAK